MNAKLSKDVILEFLQTKESGQLYHRESRTVEFKESFNFAGLAEYFKDFAAFANNAGGYLIFGVTNYPRTAPGLNAKSADMFDRIDEAKISESVNDIFVPSINWERIALQHKGLSFAAFYVQESSEKPVIAKKDEGAVIKSGEIYYRYAGRSEKILFAELHAMIERRLDRANQRWIELMSRIAKVGPANAAILDTEKGIIQKGENQTLLIDEKLIPKLKFVREGKPGQQAEETALRIVGDVQPVGTVEVTKIEKRSLLELYPFSCSELVTQVKARVPHAKEYAIFRAIKENELKKNPDYSAYNFRNKRQEEKFKETGEIPTSIPTIYNQSAVDFLAKVLRNS